MSGHETEKPHAGNWTGICGEALSLLSKGKPFSHVASQSKPNKIAGHEMSQLEKKKTVVRERNYAFWVARELGVLHRSFFLGKDGWSSGRREETGGPRSP